MWRVVLSVTAAVFDGLLLLLMSLGLLGISKEPTSQPIHRTAVHAASVAQSAQVAGLIFGGILIAIFVLNLLAIGFGARLPIRRRASAAAIASEFA